MRAGRAATFRAAAWFCSARRCPPCTAPVLVIWSHADLMVMVIHSGTALLCVSPCAQSMPNVPGLHWHKPFTHCPCPLQGCPSTLLVGQSVEFSCSCSQVLRFHAQDLDSVLNSHAPDRIRSGVGHNPSPPEGLLRGEIGQRRECNWRDRRVPHASRSRYSAARASLAVACIDPRGRCNAQHSLLRNGAHIQLNMLQIRVA